jgi:hypothetical protein
MENVNLKNEIPADAKPVLADSKKFVRCLGCEWIACENHKVCLRDKIK